MKRREFIRNTGFTVGAALLAEKGLAGAILGLGAGYAVVRLLPEKKKK